MESETGEVGQKHPTPCQTSDVSSCVLAPRLDKSRYRSLIHSLHNQHTRGISQYPENLSDAYSLAVQYKPERNIAQQSRDQTSGMAPNDVVGANFLQTDTPAIPGLDGITENLTCLTENLTCLYCNSGDTAFINVPLVLRTRSALQQTHQKASACNYAHPHLTMMPFPPSMMYLKTSMMYPKMTMHPQSTVFLFTRCMAPWAPSQTTGFSSIVSLPSAF